MDEPIDIFIAYSRNDASLRTEFQTHLAPLMRTGAIRLWNDQVIRAGEAWEAAINVALAKAKLILLLVSPDFISSDYCYDNEMMRALEREAAGEARVIPIILRSSDWKRTPLGKLQALPSDAKPVVSWLLRDDAWHDVVQGVSAVVDSLRTPEVTAGPWPSPPQQDTQASPATAVVNRDALLSDTQVTPRPNSAAATLAFVTPFRQPPPNARPTFSPSAEHEPLEARPLEQPSTSLVAAAVGAVVQGDGTEPEPTASAHITSKISAEDLTHVKSPEMRPIGDVRGIRPIVFRCQLQAQPQHDGIRADDRRFFRAAMTSQRIVWLVSEWGLGKEEFLASCFGASMSGDVEEIEVVRVRCDDLLAGGFWGIDVEARSSALIDRILEEAALCGDAPILFDYVPQALALSPEVARARVSECEKIADALLTLEPNARVVIAARWFPDGARYPTVELWPLDEADCRSYIAAHPSGGQPLAQAKFFDRLFVKSDGVPAYLDRLLMDLQACSIDELTDPAEHTDIFAGPEGEFFVISVVQAISVLQRSTDKNIQRGLVALKALSILAHGETFGIFQHLDLRGIQHLVNNEPFRANTVHALQAVGLLRVAEIVDLEDSVQHPTLHTGVTAPKLLVVMPQIRDYVRHWELTTDEYRALAHRMMDHFFGTSWNLHAPSMNWMMNTPLSETAFAVLVWLLRDAIKRANKHDIDKMLFVAEMYVGTLRVADKFRDVYITSSELIRILDGAKLTDEAAKMSYSLGFALRMLHRHQEALVAHERALAQAEKGGSKDVQACIRLELAECHHSLGDDREATIYAREAFEQASKKRASYYQAQQLLIQLDSRLSHTEAREQLKQIEDAARKRGYNVVANNILIHLASTTQDPVARSKLRQRVMASHDDRYNRIRATIANAKDLVSANRIDDLVGSQQRYVLSAYKHLYEQRMDRMVQSCHDVLWAVGKAKKSVPFLTQLMRYTSNYWRTQGVTGREGEYLKDLKTIAPKEFSSEIEEKGLFSSFFGSVLKWIGRSK